MINTIKEVKLQAEERFKDLINKETPAGVLTLASLQKQLSTVSDSMKSFIKRDETAQVVKHPKLSTSGAAIVTEAGTSDLMAMEVLDQTKIGYIFESDEEVDYSVLLSKPTYSCNIKIPVDFNLDVYRRVTKEDYIYNYLMLLDADEIQQMPENEADWHPIKFNMIITNAAMPNDCISVIIETYDENNDNNISLVGLTKGSYEDLFETGDNIVVENGVGWFLVGTKAIRCGEEQLKGLSDLFSEILSGNYYILDYFGLLSDEVLSQIAQETFGNDGSDGNEQKTVSADQVSFDMTDKQKTAIKDFFISNIDKSLYLKEVDLIKSHPVITKTNKQINKVHQGLVNVETEVAAIDQLLKNYNGGTSTPAPTPTPSADTIQIVDELAEATSEVMFLKNGLKHNLSTILINHEDIGRMDEWVSGVPDFSQITPYSIGLKLPSVDLEAFSAATGKDWYYTMLIAASLENLENKFRISITNLEFRSTSDAEAKVNSIHISILNNDDPIQYYGLPPGEYLINDKTVTLVDEFNWVSENYRTREVSVLSAIDIAKWERPAQDLVILDYLDLMPDELLNQQVGDILPEGATIEDMACRVTPAMLEVIKDIVVSSSSKSLYNKSGEDLIASHDSFKNHLKAIEGLETESATLKEAMYRLVDGFDPNTSYTDLDADYTSVDTALIAGLRREKLHYENTQQSLNAIINQLNSLNLNSDAIKYQRTDLPDVTTVKGALDTLLNMLASADYKDSLAEYVIAKIPDGDGVEY